MMHAVTGSPLVNDSLEKRTESRKSFSDWPPMPFRVLFRGAAFWGVFRLFNLLWGEGESVPVMGHEVICEVELISLRINPRQRG